MIASVRVSIQHMRAPTAVLTTFRKLAFASRVKLFYTWKSAEAEKTRIRNMHEKTLRQRGLDRQSIMPLQREIEMVCGSMDFLGFC